MVPLTDLKTNPSRVVRQVAESRRRLLDGRRVSHGRVGAGGSWRFACVARGAGSSGRWTSAPRVLPT